MTKHTKLGQHFLTGRNAVDAVVHTIVMKEVRPVVEIGPGKGALTEKILACGVPIIAVEKDIRLVRGLTERFGKEIGERKLTLVHDDIRNFQPAVHDLQPNGYVLAGNIPYYLTGDLLRTFLSATVQPHKIVFVIQKEVADRIVMRGKKGSVLSISVAAYGTPRYVQTLKKGAFSPPPRVDSAIISIENISRNFFKNIDEKSFFDIVKRGFAHKRKLLRSNLDVSGDLLTSCGIRENARAEDLSPDDWKCLSQKIKYLG